MPPDSSSDITALLHRAQSGDAAAHDALLTAVYAELKLLSHAQLRGASSTMLDTTSLVHETYLRMVGKEGLSWPDRRRFFAYAARAMRTIVVDHARRHLADKRGGGVQAVPLENLDVGAPGDFVDLLALNDVLTRVARIDPRIADVLELHVFGGLEFQQIAACLETSERSVYRTWQKGRLLIDALLRGEEPPPAISHEAPAG